MIGSHNTFTWLRPIKWWMRPLSIFAKCQNEALRALMVNLADIRIRYKDNQWWVSHGPVIYCSLDEAIHVCKMGNLRKVRVLFEGKRVNESLYLTLQDKLDSFENIQFYEGRDKKTWEKLLDLPDIEVTQYVGSMQSKIGKVFPWVYYIINKKKLLKLQEIANLDTEKYFLFDFL